MYSRQEETVMQQNNDNIRHHANPVKQGWYSQIITLLFTLCLLMTATVSMATETLLSQGRTATQSTTDYNGPPNLAVDGNTNGDWYVGYSVTHTAYETQPWWQVDLAQVATLSQVTIWNRIDCCSDRTANFYVLTSATDMTGQSLTQLLADPAVTSVLVPTLGSSPSITVQLNNVQARYVRVQLVGDNWLHLAEVQVFGTASIPTNVPPSVTLTSPSHGVNYIQGAAIPLTASATDSDGIITKVEFYDGTTLINTDTTAPYNYNWATNEIGPHNLTAKVYDDGVLVTTSAVVLITVSGTGTSAIPPSNAIQCASEEEVCTLPTGVTATVWYGTEMSWFSQTGVTGSINCSNTVFGDPVMGYSKSCWYVAENTTTNTPPTVTLTSPANGANYNQGNSIPFAATATDSDGTIAKVEFYDGSTLIYTANAAPYSIGVVASTIGSHAVTAVATDNNGATTISNTAQVTINAASNGTPQAYYIHTDQLNTPRLITDNNNQAVWRWDNWEPFGNYITDEDPGNTGNKFIYNPRFAGQYYDVETGLSYNYFRDYNPQTGRYLQSDPIGLEGGINTYAYVGGNPIGVVDPLGLAKLTGMPSNFSDAVKWRKKYKNLIDADRIMRERLKAYCGKDKKRLQKIFDDWEVYVDPNINDVAHRSRGTYATTNYNNQSTQFNNAFFGSGTSGPGTSFIFTHEFRHLMKENNDLASSAGLADELSGHSERVPYEMDADNFARNFPNECTCGN